MRQDKTIPWHNEARRLFADGMAPEEISKRLSKVTDKVKIVLDFEGAREKDRARRRAAREEYRKLYGGFNHHNDKPIQRARRVVPKQAPVEAKLSAARDYLSGKIDREEMLRIGWDA